MTFTTGLRDHDVVMAVDKSNEHTGVAGATEGDQSFAFDNTSNTIDEGDLVFCSDQADANVQYLGLCITDSGAAGITTELPLQTTPGASLKIWEPTTSVRLQYRMAIGGQEHLTDDGVLTTLTRGATGFQLSIADESKTLSLRFDPTFPGEYELWRAFRAARAQSTTQPTFSLAFWDQQVELSKVHEVLAIASGRHSAVQPAHFSTRFRQPFFIVNEDTYAGT